jgi:murein DD-endopeptidase MepM/ murein hydrolase activator NlpD
MNLFAYIFCNVLLINVVCNIPFIATGHSKAYANSETKEQYYNRFLPKHKPVPGGIAIVPLDLGSIESPTVLFNQKKVLTIKYHNNLKEAKDYSQSNWIAVIGIPMYAKPGVHKIQVYLNQDQDNMIEKSFIVSPEQYISEKLTLSDKFVNPSFADQARIKKERELIGNAYKHWSQGSPNLSLRSPIIANNHKSSIFGLKRILNGQNKGFHSGLDLAAPTGTKVYSAASGKVILTGSFFYSGNVVFVDHGQGLITNYCHLESIVVKEGDMVDIKTVLGTVGASGRVTGPHLHWSVSLNDTRVDPELFLS